MTTPSETCERCSQPATTRYVEVRGSERIAHRYCEVHAQEAGFAEARLARLMRFCQQPRLMARNGYDFDRVKREMISDLAAAGVPHGQAAEERRRLLAQVGQASSPQDVLHALRPYTRHKPGRPPMPRL